jgi:hypothetical protein
MFISTDGNWRVSTVTLDGRDWLRVESIEPITVTGRCGKTTTERSADGWYKAGDVLSPEQIEQWVPLDELREVNE